MDEHMGFTDCVYFLLITMSTVNMFETRKIKFLPIFNFRITSYEILDSFHIFQVGYGDFSPGTQLGKFYLILFLFFGIVFFANSLPEIGALIGNRPK